MKNIKIYLFAIVSGLLTVSCNDAIDLVQAGELYPSTAFETVNDLQLGLNGVYAYARDEAAIEFSSIFTDEVAIGIANGGQGRSGELTFVLNTTSDAPYAIWQQYYKLIANANRIIEAGAAITPEENEVESLNKILAEAHALRAYGHLQLMTYFCTDMKNDGSLGVIALDHVTTTTEFLPRNTAGEVFTLINADLDFADANLPTVISTAERFYISKYFITAFRARLAAYRGQYASARTYAESLIGTGAGKYKLSTKGTSASNQYYQNIFKDVPITATINNEVIFNFSRIAGDANFAGVWASLNSTVNGSAFYEVGRALYNAVAANPADVRIKVIADPTSIIDPNYQSSTNYIATDIITVGKYPGSNNTNLSNDVKVFRISEMYFIIAEAQASAGDYAGAAASISAVRTARFGTPVTVQYNTAQEAWAGILDERRIELAFEGFRYIDLKRLGTLAGKGIDRDPKDCEVLNGLCSIPTTDYRFTMPIPRAEISINPNIQQNPGY